MKGKSSSKYAIKTMKKAEIINSKHVDHIENEKNILERVNHPFAVSLNFFLIIFSWNTMDFFKTIDTSTSLLNCYPEVIYSLTIVESETLMSSKLSKLFAVILI